MSSGIDLNAVVNFTLPEDTENPTIWKLGILPSYLLGQLSTKIEQVNQIDLAFQILQLAIKGWENFDGIEYATVEATWFNRKVNIVPMELLERLDLKTITALSAKIPEINKLTPAERKN